MQAATLLLYCRPGFEKECAAEIIDVAAAGDLFGYVKSKPDSGYVQFCLQQEQALKPLRKAIRFHELMFARQLLFDVRLCTRLPEDDRITPLLASITEMQRRFADVRLETADTNDGKQVQGFCKKFRAPLLRALEQQQLMDDNSDCCLHLMFLTSSSVFIGLSFLDNSSPFDMGIPRLRMPRQAPSRSTLKLEEAILTLLDDDERDRYLHNGQTAVDLGASPGGWTWQLVQRGIRVQAVDNGPMDQALLDSGLVKHVRADGFKFRPQQPVDWLVCDMVERPLHIARLIGRWVNEGHCRHAIFNLKLPMKQRYPIVRQCIDLLRETIGGDFDLRIKQLYHDREEVTCLILSD